MEVCILFFLHFKWNLTRCYLLHNNFRCKVSVLLLNSQQQPFSLFSLFTSVDCMRRNDTSYMRHVSIVNIAVSLLIANICFIIGAAIAEQEQPPSVDRCSPAVFFMHFFYLALFFWMLMSALLLFYRTVMVLSQMSRAKMMVIAFTVGYGAPLLIAVITVASTAGPQNYISKRNACWLNWNESKALLAFVIPALTIGSIHAFLFPVGTIILVNMFSMMVVIATVLKPSGAESNKKGDKEAMKIYYIRSALRIHHCQLPAGINQSLHANYNTLNSTIDIFNHLYLIPLYHLYFQGFFILLTGCFAEKRVCTDIDITAFCIVSTTGYSLTCFLFFSSGPR
uniref:G-protein coupled receptors family 2 profile 2 domain-containing protein n=1 Tax=Sinocyclocheilus rhinocerous TaxID=307959 RepID=A0A673GFQ5_9TELE